jgi:DNA integrity scanning protein DisA with diadenylate cyclase activity
MRQELLSMDGATILRHTGEVVTAGAIVRVPGGSSGGGRRAAAMQLSKLGLAIKISEDGPISGFRNRDTIFSL